jgi:hypothetical protein
MNAPHTTIAGPATFADAPGRATSDDRSERRTTRAAALAKLRSLTYSKVSTPDDADWDNVRRPWNVAVDQQPLAVLDAQNVADVVTAVRWASASGFDVTAQPTGHGVTTGFDDVLVVRTGGLDSIEVDVEARTASVGAGVRAGDLLRALEGTGLTYLAGSSPGPSVVGMTLTGGISWFSRAFGIGANSVRAVELVDGRGALRWITAESDPELFFAVRGAGGDFGIVTRIEIELHPAQEIFGGRMLWPVEQMGEVLRAFRTVTENAPHELSVWFQLLNVPPLPEIPDFLRGKSFAIAAFVFLGNGDGAATLLAPFHQIDGCVMNTSAPVELANLGAIADEPMDPTPVHERGRLLTGLDDQFIDSIVEQIGADTEPMITMTQIRHLGGAFAESVEHPSAFGVVAEPYQLFAIGVVPVPEAVAPVDAALDGLVNAVSPWSSGRSMLAFLGPDSTDRWWDQTTRARLVAAKRRTDPLGVVRSNRPVERH